MLVYQRVIEMTMPSWFAYISLDDPESSRKKAQAFVVEAGNLWFNVMVWVPGIDRGPGDSHKEGMGRARKLPL